MDGGTRRPGGQLRDTVIRKKEVLARLEEVEEYNFRSPVGTGQSTSQAPLHLGPVGRSNQGQGTRVQAGRDQGQQTPGQGRGGDGGRPHGSREAPTQARPRESGEMGRRDQPPPGYLRQFPMLTRGRTKMEAERSGLNDVIKENVREGGGAIRERRSYLKRT